MDKDLVYKIALTQIPGIGSVLAKSLIGYCGGVNQVFEKSHSFLKKVRANRDRSSWGQVQCGVQALRRV